MRPREALIFSKMREVTAFSCAGNRQSEKTGDAGEALMYR